MGLCSLTRSSGSTWTTATGKRAGGGTWPGGGGTGPRPVCPAGAAGLSSALAPEKVLVREATELLFKGKCLSFLHHSTLKSPSSSFQSMINQDHPTPLPTPHLPLWFFSTEQGL